MTHLSLILPSILEYLCEDVMPELQQQSCDGEVKSTWMKTHWAENGENKGQKCLSCWWNIGSTQYLFLGSNLPWMPSSRTCNWMLSKLLQHISLNQLSIKQHTVLKSVLLNGRERNKTLYARHLIDTVSQAFYLMLLDTHLESPTDPTSAAIEEVEFRWALTSG